MGDSSARAWRIWKAHLYGFLAKVVSYCFDLGERKARKTYGMGNEEK